MFRAGETVSVTGRIEKSEKMAGGYRLVLTVPDRPDTDRAAPPALKAEKR